MVINRIRFPKLLNIVQKRCGDIATVIMEELILHGRLRFNQLKKDTYVMLQEKHEIVVTEEEVNDEIEKVFREMVKVRLIVSVPYLEIQRRSLERMQKLQKAADEAAKTQAARALGLGNVLYGN